MKLAHRNWLKRFFLELVTNSCLITQLTTMSIKCDVKLMKSFLLLLQLIFVSPSDAKNYEYRLIQSNNFQRQELLQQKCDKFHLDNDYVNKLSDGEMEHLLVDKEHKFLYCYVPKVSVSYLFSIQHLSLLFGARKHCRFGEGNLEIWNFSTKLFQSMTFTP